MLIGELSQRSGVSARSLRYYESHDLLHAERSENGYRSYGEAAVERARTAHLLFDLGIERDLVRSVLACTGDVSAEVHRATRDQLADVRDRMSERIAELTQAHARLARIIDDM